MRSHGPQIEKGHPVLAWMLTKNMWPSGLNKVDPANSSPKRDVPSLAVRRRFSAWSQSWEHYNPR